MSAPKLYTALLPACCAQAQHSINDRGIAVCLHCRTGFTWQPEPEEWTKGAPAAPEAPAVESAPEVPPPPPQLKPRSK